MTTPHPHANDIATLLADGQQRTAPAIRQALDLEHLDAVQAALQADPRFAVVRRQVVHADPQHRDDEDGCPEQDVWRLVSAPSTPAPAGPAPTSSAAG